MVPPSNIHSEVLESPSRLQWRRRRHHISADFSGRCGNLRPVADPPGSYREGVNHVLSLTAVYTPVEDGWIQAHLAELPGVVTVAESRAAAEEMLLDALHEYLRSLLEGPTTQPDPSGKGATSEGRIQVRISVELG